MSARFLFKDRKEAGLLLAERLQPWRRRRPLILAIPRGAVPIAKIIADRLDAELDVVLVRKLSSPLDPEFALGAIDERGRRHLSPDVAPDDAGLAWMEQQAQRELALMRQRRAAYSGSRPPADPCGRVLIVVDDGMATGATMAAALRALRAELPLELVAATPVAAPAALQLVGALADRTVCLEAPMRFIAVSRHYRDFPQVGEEEVVALLAERFAVQKAVSQNG